MKAMKAALNTLSVAICFIVAVTVSLLWFPGEGASVAMLALALTVIAVFLVAAWRTLKAEIDWKIFEAAQDRDLKRQ